MTQDIEQSVEKIKTEKDFFVKAKLLGFLKKDKQIPLVEISQKVNLKPSYISHILRLNKLPELIIDGYYSKLISISHLFLIARLKSDDSMVELYEKILRDNLTTFQTEELVRENLYAVKTEGEYLSKEEIQNFMEKFKKDSRVKIKIIQTRIKGKFILEVFGNLKETSSFLREIIKLFDSAKVE